MTTTLALLLLPASAAAAPKIDGMFPVPGIGANNKIVEGPDGNMWVTVSSGENDVARITPSGEVKEFALREGLKEVKEASGIARDAEGHLWVTARGGNEELGALVRFSPSNPEGTTVVLIDTPVKVPFAPLVLGPDGRMWVATDAQVLAFKPTDPQPELSQQKFPISGLTPRDIDVAGQLLAISDSDRIVTLTTAGVEKNYALGGTSQGAAGNKDGLIAYSSPGSEPQVVGLISPPSLLPPINTPPPGGDPFGVALGADGAFWFVMGAFGSVARLEPGGSQLSFVEGLPKDGLERQIAAGPNNTLWVTISKEGAEGVGRVTGVESPPKNGGAPETRITKGPKGKVKTRGKKAKVSFRFNSPNAGANFECRMVRKRKGSKAPSFATCKSPKTYRLKPGRYRFEVRAVLKGVADKSPASRSFKVVRAPRHRHR